MHQRPSRESQPLPISRPRRIFRPTTAALPTLGLALVLLSGVAAAGVALAIRHWPGVPTSAATPPPPAPDRLDAQPAQVAVVDGGTLRL